MGRSMRGKNVAWRGCSVTEEKPPPSGTFDFSSLLNGPPPCVGGGGIGGGMVHRSGFEGEGGVGTYGLSRPCSGLVSVREGPNSWRDDSRWYGKADTGFLARRRKPRRSCRHARIPR